MHVIGHRVDVPGKAHNEREEAEETSVEIVTQRATELAQRA